MYKMRHSTMNCRKIALKLFMAKNMTLIFKMEISTPGKELFYNRNAFFKLKSLRNFSSAELLPDLNLNPATVDISSGRN